MGPCFIVESTGERSIPKPLLLGKFAGVTSRGFKTTQTYWIFIVPAPEGFLQVISREFNETRSRNAYLVSFLTPNKHALFQRPSQNYLPKLSLVQVQKPMNAYANPGALLM